MSILITDTDDSFTPRPSQPEILAYTGGRLGISAVPGSGKTHTLSALAAQIISSGQLAARPGSADRHARQFRGGQLLRAHRRLHHGCAGLIPQLGYRVRTLHGLAHDIVREDPPLVGLDKKFSIVDETASPAMIREAADAWVRDASGTSSTRTSHPAWTIISAARSANKDWPDHVESIAASFIRSAKDRRLTPDKLRSCRCERSAVPSSAGRDGTRHLLGLSARPRLSRRRGLR